MGSATFNAVCLQRMVFVAGRCCGKPGDCVTAVNLSGFWVVDARFSLPECALGDRVVACCTVWYRLVRKP